MPPPDPTTDRSDESFLDAKQRKLDRIESILSGHVPSKRTELNIDTLTPQLRDEFGVVDTDNVSANLYDQDSLDLIARFSDGLVLDCGAGLRSHYHSNVVNLEIAAYPSTDVLSVGEVLPFEDDSFDAVLSLNVLEHVRQPFRCASEIARVMKPGAPLYCVVPFLQPLHGYPHHYYNMSHQGLANLFGDMLDIDRQAVIPSGLPIWTLSWFLQRWLDGLPEAERGQFADLRVQDLVDDPLTQLDAPWVTGLPEQSNLELASTTALFARKPPSHTP